MSPAELVFDVGANLGNRTEVFLAIGNRVIAVEPQAYCYGYLKRKFAGRITLLKTALGEKKGRLPMYINTHSSTISSLSKQWVDDMKNARFKNEIWDKTEEVEITTLDHLVDTYGRPDFVKIDVEGFETEVLKGLSTPIKTICFEYTLPEHLDKFLECLTLLQGLDGNYLCNFSRGEENKFLRDNWVLIPEFKNWALANPQILGGFGDVYVKLPIPDQR